MERKSKGGKPGRILPALLLAALLASCAWRPARRALSLPAAPDGADNHTPYTITDYKDKSAGMPVPEWVGVFLEGGVRGLEALGGFRDSYVFVNRNIGYNFRALTQWAEGFSAAQDFPRLAADRIERRFSASVPHPDEEYGAFFETLVRGASDLEWRGAVKREDFWILKEITPGEDLPEPDEAPPAETESWEFFILVTIEKTLFAGQLEGLFGSLNPTPRLTRAQANAVGRVKERFYDGF